MEHSSIARDVNKVFDIYTDIGGLTILPDVVVALTAHVAALGEEFDAAGDEAGLARAEAVIDAMVHMYTAAVTDHHAGASARPCEPAPGSAREVGGARVCVEGSCADRRQR